MNRRGFLGAIGAALAGATLDPERLLWRPGAKVISIARPIVQRWSLNTSNAMQPGDIFTIAGFYATNPVTGLSTTMLREFVVTQPVESGPIEDYFPKIVPNGPWQNVSAEGSPRKIEARRYRPSFVGMKIYDTNAVK